jgi:hypothetical protein
MFEQVSHQFLSFGKQAAEAMLKINGIAAEGLEKVIDVQLKTIEDRVNATNELFGLATEARDPEALKTLWPKSLSLAKDSGEKLYAANQEILGIVVKTNEALGDLAKANLESVNGSVKTKAPRAAAAK